MVFVFCLAASLGSSLTADVLGTEIPFGPAVVAMNCPSNATCVEECQVTVGSYDSGCADLGGIAVITCTQRKTYYNYC